MRKPLVSVIIPSYNRALLLRDRSIPSVLRQSYSNWEIIVVGDGPPNNALNDVVIGFNDSRIRYAEIVRPNYSGISAEQLWHAAGAAARNYGLTLVRGEVIAPLDDDDEFTPEHLEEAVFAITEQGMDLVYGSVLVRNFETGHDRLDYFPWESSDTQELFLRRNIMFHSSVCYNARFKNLQYPDDGIIPADYGLWLAIYRAGGRFASLDSPQAIYYGDRFTGLIRTSVPSLPPFGEFEAQLRGIYESRMLSNRGSVVQAFEQAVTKYQQVSHTVATSSGDIALIIAIDALRAREPNERNEVVLPSYAHPSLVNAIRWNGLEPIFCDIDGDTLCVNPDTVAPQLSSKTAIVVALHPHGFPVDMAPLHVLTRQHGALLLADAAGAFGASLRGRPIGGFGDMAIFSLSGTKSLTAGEGGLICFEDDRFLEFVRRTARYGIGDDWQVEHRGINGKLAEIPGALALAGLPYLDEWLHRRRQMEARYRERLSGHAALRMIQPAHPSCISSCKDMVLIFSDPSSATAVVRHLADYRIATRPYYRVLHRMPAYRHFAKTPLPVTEKIADCTVCVPLYNEIREEVLDLVASVVLEALS